MTVEIDFSKLKSNAQKIYDEKQVALDKWFSSDPKRLSSLQRLAWNTQLYDKLDSKQKAIINTAKKYRPELFVEPKTFTTPPPIEKMTGTVTPKVPNTILNTINKLGLTGKFQDYGKWLNNASTKGYLPDLKDKSVIGTATAMTAFPFQKIMNVLNTEAAAGAAGVQGSLQSIYDQTGLTKKGINSISDVAAAMKNKQAKPLTLANIFTPENIKGGIAAYGAGFKEAGKAAIEPIIKNNSVYQNTGYTQLLKKQGENTKLTKPFTDYYNKLTPEQKAKLKGGNIFEKAAIWGAENIMPDESGNWLQRLTSGFAGSPADVAGLGLDVALSPSTYLTGGVKAGASTGATLADDLIKNGAKLLPKGAEIAFTKEGKLAYAAFEKMAFGGALDDVAKQITKTATGATDSIAIDTIKNAIKNKTINEFVQANVDSAGKVAKYLDLGGTKFAGNTIIPGYKYAQMGKKFEDTKVGSMVQKLFNADAGIPNAFRPIKDWLQSAGEKQTADFTKAFATVIKDSKVADLDNIQKFRWLTGDIEKVDNKLSGIYEQIADITNGGVVKGADAKKLTSLYKRVGTQESLITKYTDRIKELAMTPEQLATSDNLTKFWKGVADQFKAATGKTLDTYETYAPIRYLKDKVAGAKSTMLGPVEQAFEKRKNLTMLQAEKLQAEGKLGQAKDIVSSTTQRLYEQEKNIFRTRMLEEVKQYGVSAKTQAVTDTLGKTTKVKPAIPKGFIEVKDIPELKGLSIPKEYYDVFKKTYSTFFGDDATAKIAQIYDKGLTIWKRAVLATPGYHFRNFFTDNVSGLMEWGLDFYNPKYWDAWGKIKDMKHELITLNGVQRYADDVAKEMLETGELVTQSLTEGGIKTLIGAGKSKQAQKFIQKVSLAEASLKFGTKREDVARTIGGLIERDKGANKIMAAAKVKDVFFDYAHSLTPSERNIAKRIVPFYTWLKNNLRRQVELILTRTGRYATIPKAMNFVENISNKPEGYEEFQQPYLKDLGAIATPLRQPGLPDWLADLMGKQRTKQAGNMLQFNPNLAFQDFSKLNWKDLISSIAPFLKAPLEIGFNQNIFYGSPITNRGNVKVKPTEASSILQKILGIAPDKALEAVGMFRRKEDGKIMLSPMTYYLLSQSPQFGLSQRGFAGTENSAYQNLSSMAGIKFIPYNDEKAKEQYQTNWSTEAGQVISDYENKQGKDYKMPETDQNLSAYKYAYEKAIAEPYADILKTKALLEVLGSNKPTDDAIAKSLEPYYAELDKLKGANIEDLIKLFGRELSLAEIESIIEEKKNAK